MQVILGYDGTSTSQRALAYAAGHTVRNAGTLVIAWVDPGVSPLLAVAAAAGGSVITPALAEPELLALELRIHESMPDLTYEIVRRKGEAARELECLAQERKADLLVIGRSRIPARHVLGSVAGRLVRHAKCPIVVVP